MSNMQPQTWREVLAGNNFRPRLGQEQAFKLSMERDRRRLVTVVPTGYGKTIIGLGSYFIRRAITDVNRLIVVVPSDALREQWCSIIDRKQDAHLLGSRFSNVVSLSDPCAAFKYSSDNEAEIFVATYQGLLYDSKSWIQELMHDQSNWMVVLDEFHRLREDQAWAKSVRQLWSSPYVVYLSATPWRSDNVDTVAGTLNTETDADVFVSLRKAHEEQAIRTPLAHDAHYFIDVEQDGEIVRLTSESLQGETDFANYETKRQFKYCSEFLNELLLKAFSELNLKNAIHPRQHQMLVFAMTCRHAESVANQLNAIDEPGFADWIGVTRTDQKNKSIREAYLSGNLQCLVQIDKVTEGFDCDRCSVLLFLNLIHSNPKLWQQIGRGLRRNVAVPWDDDICDIFCSSDSEVASLIKQFEVDITLSDTKERGDCDCCSDCPDCKHHWKTLPDINVIDAEFERIERVSPEHIESSSNCAALAHDCGAPDGMDLEWLARYTSRIQGIRDPERQQRLSFATENAKIQYYQDRCERAVGAVASLLAGRVARLNGYNKFAKHDWVELKIKLNRRWKSQNSSCHTAGDYRKKYAWAQRLHEELKNIRNVPRWASL